ncbi:MAG: COX15/CtaA family protein [bacterium]
MVALTHRRLHFYALFVACATLVLLLAGAMVTSTGSGLSVPDWPTTYGYSIFTYPLSAMVGGIRFEHTHRLIAATVGLLTLVLAIWLWRVEARAWVRRLGFAAVLLVIVQGALGGMAVLLHLPPSVSILHATLAQCFFCVAVSLALFTSPGWGRSEAGAVINSPLRWVSWALFASVLAQLIAGSILRHTGIGLAFHIAGAVLVTGFAVAAFVLAKRIGNQSKFLRIHGKGGLHLVLFQAVLGIASLVLLLTGWETVPPPMIVPVIVSLHLVMGAMVLANFLLLALWSHRLIAAGAQPSAAKLTTGITP